jgi:transposase
MTASQIAKATGIGAGTVSTMLTEMAKTGELAKADPQVGQRCDDHLASAQRQFVRAHCTTCAADDVGVHGARHVCWTLLFARTSRSALLGGRLRCGIGERIDEALER